MLAQGGGADGPRSTVEVYKQEESEEKVTVLVGVASPEEAGTVQGGKLQQWELSRVLNLKRER